MWRTHKVSGAKRPEFMWALGKACGTLAQPVLEAIPEKKPPRILTRGGFTHKAMGQKTGVGFRSSPRAIQAGGCGANLPVIEPKWGPNLGLRKSPRL